MGLRSLVACALVVLLAGVATAGELAGDVGLDVAGANLADLGPTVVFLDAASPSAPLPAAPRPPVLRQHNSQFEPSFLVVVAGQSVRFTNDDTIFHNVFSFSRPNDFDLGVYPSGQSRSVRFSESGVVKVYCSIHESMNATVLVTPTSLFDVVSASGAYRLRDVPAGRYQLTVWNERLPVFTRSVDVGGGKRVLDVKLGGAAP